MRLFIITFLVVAFGAVSSEAMCKDCSQMCDAALSRWATGRPRPSKKVTTTAFAVAGKDGASGRLEDMSYTCGCKVNIEGSEGRDASKILDDETLPTDDIFEGWSCKLRFKGVGQFSSCCSACPTTPKKGDPMCIETKMVTDPKDDPLQTLLPEEASSEVNVPVAVGDDACTDKTAADKCKWCDGDGRTKWNGAACVATTKGVLVACADARGPHWAFLCQAPAACPAADAPGVRRLTRSDALG